MALGGLCEDGGNQTACVVAIALGSTGWGVVLTGGILLCVLACILVCIKRKQRRHQRRRGYTEQDTSYSVESIFRRNSEDSQMANSTTMLAESSSRETTADNVPSSESKPEPKADISDTAEPETVNPLKGSYTPYVPVTTFTGGGAHSGHVEKDSSTAKLLTRERKSHSQDNLLHDKTACLPQRHVETSLQVPATSSSTCEVVEHEYDHIPEKLRWRLRSYSLSVSKKNSLRHYRPSSSVKKKVRYTTSQSGSPHTQEGRKEHLVMAQQTTGKSGVRPLTASLESHVYHTLTGPPPDSSGYSSVKLDSGLRHPPRMHIKKSLPISPCVDAPAKEWWIPHHSETGKSEEPHTYDTIPGSLSQTQTDSAVPEADYCQPVECKVVSMATSSGTSSKVTSGFTTNGSGEPLYSTLNFSDIEPRDPLNDWQSNSSYHASD